jgi:hypothetical protein
MARIRNRKQGIYPDGRLKNPLNLPGFAMIYLRFERKIDFA